MNTTLIIFISLGIILLNIGIGWLFRIYILRQKNLNMPIEKLFSKFQILEKIDYGCMVVFSALFSYLFYQLGERLGISFYILALTPFIYIVFQLIIVQILFHRIHKELRQIETTLKEDMLHFFKMLSVMFLPAILLIFFRVYFMQNSSASEYLFYLVLLLGIISFTIIYPYLIKIILKGESIKSTEIEQVLQNFLYEQHIKNTSLYQFKSKKSKVANAMIIGIFKKNIFFSDYLLENLTNEEIKGILAHELGHLKKNHLLIKGILFIALLPIFIGLGYSMDYFEELFNFQIPIPLGIIFMLGGMLLYISFIFLKLSKIQEYQADRYVIDLGLDKATFIQALQKMTNLNNQMSESANLGELLGTHPSLNNRIKQIRAYKSH